MRAVRTWAKDWAEENAIHDGRGHLRRQLVRLLEEDGLAGTGGLDDCPHATFDAGCAVSAKPHAFHGFVLFEPENVHFPGIADGLHYHTIDKMLFRLVKE